MANFEIQPSKASTKIAVRMDAAAGIVGDPPRTTPSATALFTWEECGIVGRELLRMRRVTVDKMICLCIEGQYECFRCELLGVTDGQA